ncbi:hypothetical protein EVAR_53801_1 [Eumeta japonica]|uniref:Uncharacterized protein n=1 Tax=Eumeta variegata TaxID=151549 RepID=A0A4C1Y054_EUMVA|nr:hypothetical protein EVAR_53801_1 [Eumeta japonica]
MLHYRLISTNYVSSSFSLFDGNVVIVIKLHFIDNLVSQPASGACSGAGVKAERVPRYISAAGRRGGDGTATNFKLAYDPSYLIGSYVFDGRRRCNNGTYYTTGVWSANERFQEKRSCGGAYQPFPPTPPHRTAAVTTPRDAVVSPPARRPLDTIDYRHSPTLRVP